MERLALFGLGAFLLVGCYGVPPGVNPLSRDDVNEELRKASRFAIVELIDSPHITEAGAYSDELIEASFTPSPWAIGFRLKNKTSDVIKVIWDECAFMDIDSSSNRTIHNGVRITDLLSPQTPSVVPPGAEISDAVIPINRLIAGSGTASLLPLFHGSPPVDQLWPCQFIICRGSDGLSRYYSRLSDAQVQELFKGKTFSLLITLDGRVKRSQVFKFRIVGFKSSSGNV